MNESEVGTTRGERGDLERSRLGIRCRLAAKGGEKEDLEGRRSGFRKRSSLPLHPSGGVSREIILVGSVVANSFLLFA